MWVSDDWKVPETNQVFPAFTLDILGTREVMYFLKECIASKWQYICHVTKLAQRQEPRLCCPVWEYKHTPGMWPMLAQKGDHTCQHGNRWVTEVYMHVIVRLGKCINTMCLGVQESRVVQRQECIGLTCKAIYGAWLGDRLDLIENIQPEAPGVTNIDPGQSVSDCVVLTTNVLWYD